MTAATGERSVCELPNSIVSRATIMQSCNRRRQLRPGGATWRTRRDIRIVFYSGPFAPLCENEAPTKPEVHNVLHCRQRKTEHRQTDRHTDTLLAILCLPTWGQVIRRYIFRVRR